MWFWRYDVSVESSLLLCLRYGYIGALWLQVLTPLEPLDYIVVAFLPGLTEVSIRNLLNIISCSFVICWKKKLQVFFWVGRGRAWGGGSNSFLMCVHRAGTSFPWCVFAAFGAGLEKCLPSCCFIWDIAPGQWSKIFLCCLVLVTFSVDSFSFTVIESHALGNQIIVKFLVP